jgi:hypothetical protein
MVVTFSFGSAQKPQGPPGKTERLEVSVHKCSRASGRLPTYKSTGFNKTPGVLMSLTGCRAAP